MFKVALFSDFGGKVGIFKPPCPPEGAQKQVRLCSQDMQAFEIESETDQHPFASGFGLTTQRELTKAQHGFDDANHRLYSGLAQTINGVTDLRLELVVHHLR